MNTTGKLVFLTAILASLSFALIIQHQDVAAFNDKNQGVVNDHSHFQFGTLTGNEGTVTNSGIAHTNDNFNSHREDTTKENSFIKPGNENPGN